MKICELFLVVCVFTVTSSNADANLTGDLLEFVNLVPKRKILRIGAEYVIFDHEFREFYKYIRSDEFSSAWNEILRQPDIDEFIKFLKEQGIKTASLLSHIAHFLGLDPTTHRSEIMKMHRKRSGGLRGFIKDILDALPLDQMDELFDRKMKESDDFKWFINKIAKFNFVAVKEYINKSNTLSAVARTLHKYQINVDLVIDDLAELFQNYKTTEVKQIVNHSNFAIKSQ